MAVINSEFKLNVNCPFLEVATKEGDYLKIASSDVLNAVVRANTLLKTLSDFDWINMASILGMRNLSATVGEIFVVALERTSGWMLKKNPHQDGYPDLLAMNKVGLLEIERLAWSKNKKDYTSFRTGGIEVKATCWDVPPAKEGQNKPDIGDRRISTVKSHDWKAHHRETNNLIGIFWDFINWVPQIVSVFYSNALTEDDWGRIAKPKEGGGRTTSVSVMAPSWIRKMTAWWVAVIDSDPAYKSYFNRKYKATIIP